MTNFPDEIDKLFETAKQEHVKVLVWGPSRPGNGASSEHIKAYTKREQIRDKLREEFKNSEVCFSEDIPSIDALKDAIELEENLHARVAHVIIVLDYVSRGADWEIDHFSRFPWFRDKAYILTPKRHLKPGSAVYKAVLSKYAEEHLKGFTPQEFDKCKLREVCVQIVHRIATAKRFDSII